MKPQEKNLTTEYTEKKIQDIKTLSSLWLSFDNTCITEGVMS